MIGAVFFVAVVEGGAVPGEDGDAETVLDRERADYEDEREPRDVADVDALDADKRQDFSGTGPAEATGSDMVTTVNYHRYAKRSSADFSGTGPAKA